MGHILVAAFDHYNEAEQVRRELISNGVAQTNIQLAAANDIEAGETAAVRADTTRDESVGERIGHFFRSIFSDEDETSRHYAETYPEAVRRGSTVVTVDVDDEAQESLVEAIMERNGAIDIDERSAAWGGPDTATTVAPAATAETAAIPVVEEELKVGKRERTMGRVRIVSRMTERPVEETVNLTEEHARIERRPADRPASPEELTGFREGTVEIRETAEEPVVAKTARVVEEVVVGKETTQRQETVRDTVRRTDVDIERSAGATPGGAGDLDADNLPDPDLQTRDRR